MEFCAAINCMDGRVQLPVIRFLHERLGARYVDMITEPGPNRILSGQSPPALVQSIYDRADISVNKHGSQAIAIVGHHDCAGNPAPETEQLEHLRQAAQHLRRRYPEIRILPLWVGETFRPEEVD